MGEPKLMLPDRIKILAARAERAEAVTLPGDEMRALLAAALSAETAIKSAEIEPKPEFVWVRMPRRYAEMRSELDDGNNVVNAECNEALARDPDLVPVWLTKEEVEWWGRVQPTPWGDHDNRLLLAARRALETP